MQCPYCRSRHVIANVTVRWSHVQGRLRPERGSFCTRCSRPFTPAPPGDLSFGSVRVNDVGPALYSLQRSADVVIVRHRTGVPEVLF